MHGVPAGACSSASRIRIRIACLPVTVDSYCRAYYSNYSYDCIPRGLLVLYHRDSLMPTTTYIFGTVDRQNNARLRRPRA